MKQISMEKFMVLPFSLGCNSHSSVAVASGDHLSNSKSNVKQKTGKQGEKDYSLSKQGRKNTSTFRVIPKRNLSRGIHRLLLSIKSLSRFSVYKEEMEQETETEMEIGFPTDVKHVTHIGADGTTTTTTTNNSMKNWDDFGGPPDNIISFVPSISLHEFEWAMAAQSQGQQLHSSSKLD